MEFVHPKVGLTVDPAGAWAAAVACTVLISGMTVTRNAFVIRCPLRGRVARAVVPKDALPSKFRRNHSVVKRPVLRNTFWKVSILAIPLGGRRRSSWRPEYTRFSRLAEAISVKGW
jgi:hypothetical protein